jgi:hypothetical protein
MQDRVDASFDGQLMGNVGLDEPEGRMFACLGEIHPISREQRVEAEDLPPFPQQPVAQMRAEETSSPGDQRSRHKRLSG